jgi:hypothetical protein
MMSIQQDIGVGVFCIIVGIGMGYVTGVIAPDIKDTWKGYSRRSMYVPTTGVVEKISYLFTVDESSDSQNPYQHFLAFIKIKYEVGGKDFWVNCRLDNFQKTPNPRIENETIEDLIKHVSAFSPGQPITVQRTELREKAALALFNMQYDLGIKKIVNLKYDPNNPRFTNIDFSAYSLKAITFMVSFVLIFSLLTILGGYYKIRTHGFTAIIVLFASIIISMYVGLMLGNKKMAERSHNTINTSTQDNPDPDEIVFHKGMTMPEFP